jgi:hypothetical protein
MAAALLLPPECTHKVRGGGRSPQGIWRQHELWTGVSGDLVIVF